MTNLDTARHRFAIAQATSAHEDARLARQRAALDEAIAAHAAALLAASHAQAAANAALGELWEAEARNRLDAAHAAERAEARAERNAMRKASKRS